MTEIMAVARPNAYRALFQLVNPVIKMMITRFGAGGRDVELLRILRVRGRTSGRTYEVPVRIAVLDGKRYIVSMLGEAQWARNLRATRSAGLVVSQELEPIDAYEIGGEEKAAFLQTYFTHPYFASRARALKVDMKHLDSAEISRAAAAFPVFRVERAHATEPSESTTG